MEHYLVIDIGRRSGRHVVGWQDNGELRTEEVYHFSNELKSENGHSEWDLQGLLSEIKAGIETALAMYGSIRSLSVVAWGKDYVLMNGDEEIVPCYAGRDDQASTVVAQVHRLIPFVQLYRRTGIQFQRNNTIYQLFDDKTNGRLARATDFLMLPEYFLYKLCGIKAHDYTNATTTGMVNARTGEYDTGIIQELGFPRHLFPQLSRPAMLGGYHGIRCALCATETAASAAEGFPSDDQSLFIILGERSLLGVKAGTPLTDAVSEAAGFSNEGGTDCIRYSKEIAGTALIDRLREELYPGKTCTMIIAQAERSRFDETVDVKARIFQSGGSAKAYFDAALGRKPQAPGDYIRCAYRSIALSFAQGVEEIERNVGRRFDRIYLAGQESDNQFFLDQISDATRKKVIPLQIDPIICGSLKIQMELDKCIGFSCEQAEKE